MCLFQAPFVSEGRGILIIVTLVAQESKLIGQTAWRCTVGFFIPRRVTLHGRLVTQIAVVTGHEHLDIALVRILGDKESGADSPLEHIVANLDLARLVEGVVLAVAEGGRAGRFQILRQYGYSLQSCKVIKSMVPNGGNALGDNEAGYRALGGVGLTGERAVSDLHQFVGEINGGHAVQRAVRKSVVTDARNIVIQLDFLEICGCEKAVRNLGKRGGRSVERNAAGTAKTVAVSKCVCTETGDIGEIQRRLTVCRGTQFEVTGEGFFTNAGDCLGNLHQCQQIFVCEGVTADASDAFFNIDLRHRIVFRPGRSAGRIVGDSVFAAGTLVECDHIGIFIGQAASIFVYDFFFITGIRQIAVYHCKSFSEFPFACVQCGWDVIAFFPFSSLDLCGWIRCPCSGGQQREEHHHRQQEADCSIQPSFHFIFLLL